MYTNESLDCTW